MLDDYQLEPRLVAALAALNRQDYVVAIAALEAIKKQYGSESWGVTAQLHLIQAYTAVGEFSMALALCDSLAELPQAKIRHWLQKARPILERKAELSQSLAPPVGLAPTPTLERALSGQVLRQVSPWRLWVTQMACLGVLLVSGAWLVQNLIIQPLINFVSAWYNLNSWAWAMVWFLTGGSALVIGVGYPWAWAQLLRWKFSLQPLDFITLNTYSPESIKFWRRLAWSGFQPVPQLGFLPTAVPLIFSFGHWRRWVVISQGLLTALPADEIAILISAEIIQLRRGYNLLLGPMVFGRLLIYELYQTAVRCGNYFAQRLARNRQHQDRQVDAGLMFLNRVIYGCGCGTTALAYGLVWLLEKIIAPAARVRFYFTDRATAAFTGHPNGLSQALIHLSQAMAEVVYQEREVSPLFEPLSLILPVHVAAAITYGSTHFSSWERDWSKLTAWERQNPLKDWFSLFHSHRFLGIRLQALSIYAQKWQLKPQFKLDERPQAWKGQRQFWQQLTPVWGLFLGLFLAALVWRGGEFALRTGVIGMKFWWFANLNLMLLGWGSLGLGLGILLRINAYYPEITKPVTDPQLLKPLIESPIALPLDSVPVKLTGRLLRMRGLEHGLGQGLWLETEVGLWQLRALGWWGPFSHLWRSPFGAWGDQPIEVQGWWRRSEVPWIDVEQAHCLGSPGLVFRGRAPYWATAVFGLLVLFSLYTFLIVP